MGPVQIKPHAGSSWAPQKRPVRHRATYHRHAGVSYFFGAYNVHEDELWMHHKRKKHASEVLTFLKAIRRRYDQPDGSTSSSTICRRTRPNRSGSGVSAIRSTSSSPPPTPPG